MLKPLRNLQNCQDLNLAIKVKGGAATAKEGKKSYNNVFDWLNDQKSNIIIYNKEARNKSPASFQIY